MAESLVTILCLAIFLGFFWLSKRAEYAKEQAENKAADQLMNVAETEPVRRANLLTTLVKKGYVIEKQEPGFVRAKKPKAKFSILLFIVLLLCGGIGIFYLIWYVLQKEQVQQFVIPV